MKPHQAFEFWVIPKHVAEQTSLSFGARMVYGILWTRKNGDNLAWPSQKYIAEAIGCGKRSVQRYLQELEKAGLCEIERKGLRKTNRYHFGRADKMVVDKSVGKKEQVAKLATLDAPPLATLDAPPLAHPIVRDQRKRLLKRSGDRLVDKSPRPDRPESIGEIIQRRRPLPARQGSIEP